MMLFKIFWTAWHGYKSDIINLPGSSLGAKDLLSVFLIYQSYILPTNGEISVTPASAQATA